VSGDGLFKGSLSRKHRVSEDRVGEHAWIYIYIYTYICVCVHTHTHIHTHTGSGIAPFLYIAI
jgi:hypothetical protein